MSESLVNGFVGISVELSTILLYLKLDKIMVAELYHLFFLQAAVEDEVLLLKLTVFCTPSCPSI